MNYIKYILVFLLLVALSFSSFAKTRSPLKSNTQILDFLDTAKLDYSGEVDRLRITYIEGRYDELITLASELMVQYSDKPEPYYYTALALQKQGNHKEALELLDLSKQYLTTTSIITLEMINKAFSISNQGMNAGDTLAAANQALTDGQRWKATGLFEKAWELDRNRPDVGMQAAELLCEFKQWQRCVVILNALQKCGNQSIITQAQKLRTSNTAPFEYEYFKFLQIALEHFYKSQNYGQAMNELDLAQIYFPTRVALSYFRGYMALITGHDQEAELYLNQTISQGKLTLEQLLSTDNKNLVNALKVMTRQQFISLKDNPTFLMIIENAWGPLIKEKAITLLAQTDLKPFQLQDFARGNFHSCAIDAEGIKCWGRKIGTKILTHSDTITAPRAIAVNGSLPYNWDYQYTAVIDNAGVIFFGPLDKNEKYSATRLEFSNPKVSSISVIQDMIYAITPNGLEWWSKSAGFRKEKNFKNPRLLSNNFLVDDEGIKCFFACDKNEKNLERYDLNVNKIKSFSATTDHICIVDDQGAKCWGNNNLGQSNVPPLSNPRSISVWETNTCALDDYGVTCWGGPSESLVKSFLINPKIVNGNCAVDDIGLNCWGNNHYLFFPSLKSQNTILSPFPTEDPINYIAESTAIYKRNKTFGKYDIWYYKFQFKNTNSKFTIDCWLQFKLSNGNDEIILGTGHFTLKPGEMSAIFSDDQLEARDEYQSFYPVMSCKYIH